MLAMQVSVSQIGILLVIGLLLFAPRLPRLRQPLGVRTQHHVKAETHGQPTSVDPLPACLAVALAWLWREFYFWTIGDWE
jgi:hypothetical protein